MRRLFFLGKLHALHIFDVTNNIWASLINDGDFSIIDDGILIRLKLISSCCFCLSFFLLVLLLRLQELLEGAFYLDLTSFPILGHRL